MEKKEVKVKDDRPCPSGQPKRSGSLPSRADIAYMVLLRDRIAVGQTQADVEAELNAISDELAAAMGKQKKDKEE
jgi:hypothetical protein